MKYLKIIIPIVLLAAILVGALVVYPKLTEKYNETTTISAASNEESEAATDFTVYDADGNAVKLSDFKGKPTIVNMWATWCGYCVQELPDFDECAKEYGDKINFLMVDMTTFNDTKDDALSFVEEEGYTFPVYFDNDGEVANGYNVTGIPVTLFIDAEGKLFKIQNGYMEGETLRSYINALIGE